MLQRTSSTKKLKIFKRILKPSLQKTIKTFKDTKGLSKPSRIFLRHNKKWWGKNILRITKNQKMKV